MSLLMEALRKAEAAKRAGHSAVPEADLDAAGTKAEPATTPETIQSAPDVFKYTSPEDLLALAPREEEPLAAPTPPVPLARAPEPHITDNDDVLDDYLTTANEPELDEIPARQPSRDRVIVQQRRERAAAASMFEAKVPQENLNTRRRQRIQILAGVCTLVVLIGAGAWWYLARMTGSSAIGVNPAIANYNLEKRAPPGEPPTGTPASATGKDGTTSALAAPASPSTTAAAQPAQAANPALSAPTAKVDPSPNASKTTTTANKPAEAVLAVSDPQPTGAANNSAKPRTAAPDSAVLANPATTTPGAPFANITTTDQQPSGNILEISRSNTPSKVQPALQSAYSQLQKGNLSAANDLYQELTTSYPNNRDALLGLASVQLQLGNLNGARSTYMHLLKLNPLDAWARTGILQAIPSTDPATYEKELLALRQQFPTLAPLSYALGNHYAKNARWHEAQSAYFDALLQARRESADNVNPDYAFNLAVSLEQLGQKRAALEYYKQAESLTNIVKPGFDPMMLRQRLKELEQP